MVFWADMAFALEMLALAAGSAVVLWSCQSQGSHRLFGKIVGIFIIVVSLLTFLCTLYSSLRYREEGLFHPHLGMAPPWGAEEGRQEDMKEKMMKCPMMMEKMGMMKHGGMEPGPTASPVPGGGAMKPIH